jgi:NADPH-dependent 2,4-dienoyl-CoA reductase/sulfur reductase-like enzyme
VVAVESGPRDGAEVRVELSNGERLAVDHVVFATGYKANLAKVPYLHGLLDQVDTADGFPMLDEGFGSSLEGLCIPGYAATHDFGARRPASPVRAVRESA